MAASRRERIMVEVCRRLRTMEKGAPASDPYDTTLGVVTRGAPLEGLHKTVQCAAAVIDADEVKTPKINQMDSAIRVVIEFFVWVESGDTPSTASNRVMADIQRRLREDLKLTEPDDGRPLEDRELSNNVTEINNQLFIDGISDTQVTGAVTWNITYKHDINDPRVLVSSL